jgi:hypothetical protein
MHHYLQVRLSDKWMNLDLFINLTETKSEGEE